MFGKRYTEKRKQTAQRKLERAKNELKLAQETLHIERETKLVTAQVGMLETGSNKLTKHQMKLMQSTNKKAIAAQIAGMDEQVEKSLPALLESRQKAGQRMITSSNAQFILDVKSRAKS